LFPLLIAGGLALPVQAHPEARLALDATPGDDGGWTVHVQHLGGEVVPTGAIALEQWRDGARIAAVRNPAPLLLGSSWEAALPASAGPFDVDIAAARDGHVYQRIDMPRLPA
jgi:hypothetical protein